MKDRGKWHCLNTDHNGNCSVDCTNEPCIMVPHSPFDIEFLKKERARLINLVAVTEQKIAHYEQENEEASSPKQSGE